MRILKTCAENSTRSKNVLFPNEICIYMVSSSFFFPPSRFLVSCLITLPAYWSCGFITRSSKTVEAANDIKFRYPLLNGYFSTRLMFVPVPQRFISSARRLSSKGPSTHTSPLRRTGALQFLSSSCILGIRRAGGELQVYPTGGHAPSCVIPGILTRSFEESILTCLN